jgi:hypothetical protein
MRKALREAKITEGVTECIVELFGPEWRKRNGISAQVVTARFKVKFPESMRLYGEAMMEQYLNRIAANCLRSGTAFLRAANSRVLLLPGIPDGILANLPVMITVPGKDRRGRKIDLHKPTTHATCGEWRAYWKMLSDQLAADSENFKPVNFIKNAIEGQPDEMSVAEAVAARLTPAKT